jgi:hypothetical protein
MRKLRLYDVADLKKCDTTFVGDHFIYILNKQERSPEAKTQLANVCKILQKRPVKELRLKLDEIKEDQRILAKCSRVGRFEFSEKVRFLERADFLGYAVEYFKENVLNAEPEPDYVINCEQTRDEEVWQEEVHQSSDITRYIRERMC